MTGSPTRVFPGQLDTVLCPDLTPSRVQLCMSEFYQVYCPATEGSSAAAKAVVGFPRMITFLSSSNTSSAKPCDSLPF